MSVSTFDELLGHVDHEVEVVRYVHPSDGATANVAIQCVTCHEVLVDYDAPVGNPAEYLRAVTGIAGHRAPPKAEPDFEKVWRWEKENDAVAVVFVPNDVRSQWERDEGDGPPFEDVWAELRESWEWTKGLTEALCVLGNELIGNMIEEFMAEKEGGDGGGPDEARGPQDDVERGTPCDDGVADRGLGAGDDAGGGDAVEGEG